MYVIAVIDYDVENLRSVEKAPMAPGEKPVITSGSYEIFPVDEAIFSGVDSFGDVMGQLHQCGPINVIHQVADQGTPFPGICLRLQLMLGSSKESVGAGDPELLRGTTEKIPDCPGLRIPHMGWDSLDITPEARFFQGVEQGAYIYFVHSYYLGVEDKETMAASTQYSTRIHVSVEPDNALVYQFHPEKGNSMGLQILKNFTEINQNLIS